MNLSIVANGRRIKIVIRNSVECTCCGAKVDCTNARGEDGKPKWVTHDCEDAWFSIGGATDLLNRTGSRRDWEETSICQYFLAIDRSFNPAGIPFIPPNGELACM